jgi:hypothetical protein
MSPLPSQEAIPESTLLLFLVLCDPFHKGITGDISQQSWENISELSKLHGVTPFFYYRARSLEIRLPKQIEKEWLGYYLYQIAAEKKARLQIIELKEILDPEGIPFILLKGASAMLRLYPQPGLRTFCDQDILIPEDKVSQFKKAMTKFGYRPLSARNSPEDEELLKFDSHLDPICKDGSLMVEPHLSILGVGGDHLVTLSEIWQEKEAKSTDGMNIEHLNIEHFIIHSMFHFLRHLSDEGFSEIKWLIDLLYTIGERKIDWSKIHAISKKWGVEKDILPIMATLNHYWQTNIPLPIVSEPIALPILLQGIKNREKEYYTKLPSSYLERLSQVRKLPDIASQVRYLLHLFFPTPENLRWRYHLSSKWSMVPYYFLHLFFTSRKFFTGLWYELVYRTH